MAKTTPEHLYVHIPFCSGKCIYCSFYTLPLNRANLDAFVDALLRELTTYVCHIGELKLKTVFFGGGTPSMLEPDQLTRLCDGIRTIADTSRLEEWTMEANPDHVTPSLVSAIRQSGITRVSMGAQAMDDATLAMLGRRHSAKETIHAVHQLQNAGITDVSIDLISAIPGISPKRWIETLHEAIALNTRHLSVYSLTVEPDTTLFQAVKRGTIKPVSEAAQAAATRRTEEILREAGFRRYEISNYAKPGHECRHNLSFWRGGDYLGIGPSAVSRIGLIRTTKDANLVRYLKDVQTTGSAPYESETLNPQIDHLERLAFQFRLLEGVKVAASSDSPTAGLSTLLQNLKRRRIVTKTNDAWHLTRRGREVADSVAAEVLAL